MKVLFICSGNKKDIISPIVKNQGDTLKENNIQLDYFPIIGKGLKGFIKNYIRLKQTIKANSYNVLHAHYSFYGFYTALVCPQHKKIVVSLMGTIFKGSLRFYLIKLFAKLVWFKVIVKSERMAKQVNLKNAEIIPNGVNTKKYNLNKTRTELRNELNFEGSKKYVIFLSHPERPEKNFTLCKKAVEFLDDKSIVLIPLYDKPHTEIVKYQLAADVLMLTSISEGSPNAVKEAMAANCPVVTTDVGDVRYIIGDTEGCYISNTFQVEELASLLKKAIDYNKPTNGLEQIKKLGIDSDAIATRIINLYQS